MSKYISELMSPQLMGVVYAFVGFIIALYVLSVVYVFIDARRRGASAYVAWGIIALIPFVGLISYLVLRPHSYASDREEQELEGGDVRTVLHLHPALAPYKAAVLPLQKNKLGALASEIHADLAKYFPVDYDETGSIGKRYRRQDEIGTPFTICVDFDTEATQSVTVRDRDTMLQERVALKDLRSYIEERMRF